MCEETKRSRRVESPESFADMNYYSVNVLMLATDHVMLRVIDPLHLSR